MRLWKQALAGVLSLLVLVPTALLAQTPVPVPPPPPIPLAPAQLEQIAAPIALYPDPLLGQVLMAATYPLEVVQAARFVQVNPALQGGPLNDALREQSWDDSVKALALFPQVLAMMNDKLDWTQRLGDAFLGQPQELMDAVQRLRARARAQGSLATTAQQTIVVEQTPQPIIQIVPVNPEVIYVPVYNPVVVYGPWPYPAYPPYYYYPVGWPVGGVFFSFGPAVFVRFGLWSTCNWHRRVVVIDAPRYQRFTESVNFDGRRGELERVRTTRVEDNRFTWEPNALHRRGVRDRDATMLQRVVSPRPPDAVSREPFHGRVDAGRLGQRQASPARNDPGRPEPVRVEPAQVEASRVESGRLQPSRTDHERAQPEWAGRVQQGRIQPSIEQPRPVVQPLPRPEAGRSQPVSVPRVESAPPAPEQRRQPGMVHGSGGGGEVRAHDDRGRDGRQAIAPSGSAVRPSAPPVSAPAGSVRPPSVAAPPTPSPAAAAAAPPSPPAHQRPPGGSPHGNGKPVG